MTEVNKRSQRKRAAVGAQHGAPGANMVFDRLRHFDAVARTLHFGRAAGALRWPPAAARLRCARLLVSVTCPPPRSSTSPPRFRVDNYRTADHG